MEQNQNLQEQGKLLLPKLDVVFHALFREENKDLLGALTSDILREEVKIKTTDKNRYVDIEEAEDKLGVMDLRAELENGAHCIIEIQLKHCESEPERILFYWADAYSRQIKRGDRFGKLEKTISIAILDHELEELKGIEEIGVKWQIWDELTGKRILTDRLELIIIELPKARRKYREEPDNAICQWMMFMDNPNESEVIQIMEENKNIKKAIEELEQVSGNEKLRRIAELKEKYIRDEQASIEYAQNVGYKDGYKNGEEEGIRKGEERGIKKGVKEGMKEGIKEGENKKSREIAQILLKKQMSIEDIKEITGLNKDEIEKIRQDH